MMDGMGPMVLWMLLWGLVGLALLTSAVLGVIWLVRNLGNATYGVAGPDPAEQEVRRRYASGEIDREEYQQRLADLRADRRTFP